MLKTQEHINLISQFERDLKINGRYKEKEDKSLWVKGNIYTHGETNSLFLAYRFGYAYGKAYQRINGDLPV